jgi:endonuclease YncB( thermonuclease family)
LKCIDSIDPLPFITIFYYAIEVTNWNVRNFFRLSAFFFVKGKSETFNKSVILPDPGQPYSVQATKYLAGMVLNRVVDIKEFGIGPYNRILGVVYVDGKNMNLSMIRAGLAEVYRGKPPKGFDTGPYIKAETEARSAGRGMWSLGDKYISPKDWRKMNRKK